VESDGKEGMSSIRGTPRGSPSSALFKKGRLELLGIYPKDTKVVIRRGTCTPMYIAAMSIIDKLWKRPRCPLTGEWIKKM